ncbi:MAG: hypothetical protein JWL70_415 [Acidimicrobiia bacterium]|nr:hypothetical protein [Acidimicrobiia bacterium]
MARLEEGARHMGYELSRLIDAVVILPPVRSGPMDDLMLEAVLLHGRNVFYFLTAADAGPAGDDIWHGDFTSLWAPFAPELKAQLAPTVVQIDQRLGRLTWRWLPDPERATYTTLVQTLYGQYKAFIAVLALDPQADPAALRRFRADFATARMKLRAALWGSEGRR